MLLHLAGGSAVLKAVIVVKNSIRIGTDPGSLESHEI